MKIETICAIFEMVKLDIDSRNAEPTYHPDELASLASEYVGRR